LGSVCIRLSAVDRVRRSKDGGFRNLTLSIELHRRQMTFRNRSVIDRPKDDAVRLRPGQIE